jgi:ankyrin repeat protein
MPTAAKKKKKAEAGDGMSTRDCVKNLKSKNVENVLAALNADVVREADFLANKGGLIPLVNLLVLKAKEREVVHKTVEVLRDFLAQSADHVVGLIEAGYKGASNWAAAEALLPLLRSPVPASVDPLAQEIHDAAWAALTSIVEVAACLPPGGKNDKYQSSFLTGGNPVAAVFALLDDAPSGAGAAPVVPTGTSAAAVAAAAAAAAAALLPPLTARVLEVTSTIAMAESETFVAEFTDHVLQTGRGAPRLVELARVCPDGDLFLKLLVNLLQLSRSAAARAVLAPAGVLEVLSRALRRGLAALTAPKSTADINTMQWFTLSLRTYTTYLCEAALDGVWPVHVPAVAGAPVGDALVAALDPLVELLPLQAVPQAGAFVGELVQSLCKICDRSAFILELPLSSSTHVAGEESKADGGEGDDGDGDGDGGGGGGGGAATAAAGVVVHDRSRAVRRALFQAAFPSVMTILPGAQDETVVSDLQRLLITLLYSDGGDAPPRVVGEASPAAAASAAAPAAVGGGATHAATKLDPAAAKEAAAREAAAGKEAAAKAAAASNAVAATLSAVFNSFNALVANPTRGANCVVGVRLLAHLVLAEGNRASLQSMGTFAKLLDVLAAAEQVMQQGGHGGEFLSRATEVVCELCRAPARAAQLASAPTGVAVIKGLFFVLFHGPREVQGVSARATAAAPRGEAPVVQVIDAQMLAAAALSNVVAGAGDGGTAKVLNGADALFDKIADPDNSDLLQQAILALFAGLVRTSAGRAHTVEQLGEDRLVGLVVDLLAADSSSYTKVKAAAVANTALLLLLPYDLPGGGAAAPRGAHDSLLRKALQRGALHYLLALTANCPTLTHEDSVLRGTLDALISYLVRYGSERYAAYVAATAQAAGAGADGSGAGGGGGGADAAAAGRPGTSKKAVGAAAAPAKGNKKAAAAAKPAKGAKGGSGGGTSSAAVSPRHDGGAGVGEAAELPPFTPEEWSVLLNGTASFARYNLQGATPLHVAVVAGCEAHALDLLQHGAKCSTVDSAWQATPFLLALVYGEEAVCHVMLRSAPAPRPDVDVDALDAAGNPFLKYAYMTPSRKMLNAVLLEASSSSSSSSPSSSLTGNNAEHVDRFLELGADPNVADSAGDFPLHWVIKGASVVVRYQFASLSLQSPRAKHTHFGPEANTVARVQQLLQHGARVNVCNLRGETPLHTALLCGEHEAAALLLAAGANPNLYSSSPGVPRQLPLHAACASGSCPADLVRRLVDRGVGIPLEPAVYSNARRGLSRREKKLQEVNSVVAKEFESVVAPPSICLRGASIRDVVEFEDARGNRPLHYACGAPLPPQAADERADEYAEEATAKRQLVVRAAVVEQLLGDYKAEVDPVNGHGSTPSHFAARWSGDLDRGLKEEKAAGVVAAAAAAAAAGAAAAEARRGESKEDGEEGADDYDQQQQDLSEFGAEFEPEQKTNGADSSSSSSSSNDQSSQVALHALLVALARAGADLNVVDSHEVYARFTPLHYAIERSPALAYFMLTGLAAASGRQHEQNEAAAVVQAHVQGASPPTLHLACARTSDVADRLALVGFLIERARRAVNDLGVPAGWLSGSGAGGANSSLNLPSHVLPYTGTALHLAAQFGAVEVVHNLLLAKADVNAVREGTPEAPTPLHLAVHAGHAQCARELVEGGADYAKVVDSDNHSALFAAVAARQPAALEEIFAGVTALAAVDFPALGGADDGVVAVEDPLAPAVIKALRGGAGGWRTLLQFAVDKVKEIDPAGVPLLAPAAAEALSAGGGGDADKANWQEEEEEVVVAEGDDGRVVVAGSSSSSSAVRPALSEADKLALHASLQVLQLVHRRCLTLDEWTTYQTAVREKEEQARAATAIQATVRRRSAKKRIAKLKQQNQQQQQKPSRRSSSTPSKATPSNSPSRQPRA